MGLDAQYRFRHCKLPADSSAYHSGSDKLPRRRQICYGDSHFRKYLAQLPYYTISFLAAMQSIPGDLSEAAAIDGAGMFTRFFRITLPQLKSVSLVIVFIHVIWTAINFDFIWVMTEGGPNYATETLPIMIYRYSMKKFNVGAASALSTMMFTVMTILFVFYYRKREKINSQAG
ncbi:MAG: carbohydrate ABC transporter permease [Butyricicoccaceae bacterium]